MGAYTECWSIELDSGSDSPMLARRTLGAWLAGMPAHVQQNALLAVTELVTNAVRFGSPPISVEATVDAGTLVVEVSDSGTGRPFRRVPTESGGRGLNLVYIVADRVEIEAGRPCVRCQFAIPGS